MGRTDGCSLCDSMDCVGVIPSDHGAVYYCSDCGLVSAQQRIIDQLRAALRSDSPVGTEGVKVEAYPGPGDNEITIAVEGHDDWLTIVDSDTGTRITEPMVGYLRPASTGGERDEPEKAVFYEVGYRDGYFAGQAGRPADPSVPDGMVPVTLEGRGYGPNWKIVVRYSNALRELLRGPGEENEYHGWLLPRQVEGDDNPRKEG